MPIAKPKRGLGQVATRKRRKLAEMAEQQFKQRHDSNMNAARNELARIKAGKKAAVVADPTLWGKSMLRTVVVNQTALMRARKLPQSVGFAVNDIQHVSAWTDFSQVRIDWPLSMVPVRTDRNGTLDAIAEMKGFMQHEVGHLRFTIPWAQVLEACSVAPESFGPDSKPMHTCWNMLEDQRMESLVVEDVPRIKSYFGKMVLKHLVANGNEQAWMMLAGREYLPVELLRQSAEVFDAFCANLTVTNGAARWAALVADYKAADTEAKIMEAVKAALAFIRLIGANMPEPLDDHSKMKNNPGASPETTPRSGGSVMDLFKQPKEEEKIKDTKPGRDNYGDAPVDKPYKDDGTRRSDPFGREGQSNGGDGGDPLWSEQVLNDIINDTMEQLQAEMRTHADVKEMARSANEFKDIGGLPEYDGTGEDMIEELVARSKATARGIEEALTSYVTENEPTWHMRQERGVLDALAYRTREVGSRTYRRELDDKGEQGLDVHVSMLCDVSMSMAGGPMIALSEALYATGLACQALGIPATFTLWSSGKSNFRVWADGNITPSVWPSMGGTDPTAALDDLATHNQGMSKHLVIIFTDGQWSNGFPTLRRWAAEDRTIILVRYGRFDGPMQQDMGADEHINIDDVRKLPDQLTNALLDVLAGKGGGW